MRRIFGLDLNGWHDLAVHDARQDKEEADTVTTTDDYDVSIIDGGVGGIVVEARSVTSEDEPARFIGGPQAALSAIGRGQGWGNIGAADRRVAVRTILADVMTPSLGGEDSELRAVQLKSVAEALTAQAQEIVVLVPDTPGVDDACQQRLLDALQKRRVQCRLLWRPVALVLAALEHGQLKGVLPDQSVAIIHHTAAGFECQRLVLRLLPDHPGLLAPERSGPGWKISCPEVGLTNWEVAASDAVRRANPHVELDRHDASRLPYHLLFDETAPYGVEIVRSINGTWSALEVPSRAAIAPDLALPEMTRLEADHILFSTVLAAPFRDRMAVVIEAALRSPVQVMARANAAARGALIAGRRIERGVSHYINALQQVSL